MFEKNWLLKIIIFQILLTSSCEHKHLNYKEFFHTNESKFESLIDILKTKYINDWKLKNEVRILIYDCNEENKMLPNFICDKDLDNLMQELKIRNIILEKEYCASSVVFDKIYLKLIPNFSNPSNFFPIKAEHYVYDFCGKEIFSYEDHKIIHNSLDKNWSYLSEE